MKWSAHRAGMVPRDPLCIGTNFPTPYARARVPVRGNQFLHPITRACAREALNERSEEAMANASPALNPNPPKLVTGAQIKAARALLGWRRIDLAAAAGLHRNAKIGRAHV